MSFMSDLTDCLDEFNSSSTQKGYIAQTWVSFYWRAYVNLTHPFKSWIQWESFR